MDQDEQYARRKRTAEIVMACGAAIISAPFVILGTGHILARLSGDWPRAILKPFLTGCVLTGLTLSIGCPVFMLVRWKHGSIAAKIGLTIVVWAFSLGLWLAAFVIWLCP